LYAGSINLQLPTHVSTDCFSASLAVTSGEAPLLLAPDVLTMD
jgi:hypothetical protein